MMYARSTASSVGLAGARSATSGSLTRCGDPLRERGRLDLVARREDHRALERVLEFAHVARPVVVRSASSASAESVLRLLLPQLGDALEEVLGEQGDVVARAGAAAAGAAR